MQQTEFAYIRETGKGFDEAVTSVLKAIEKKGGWTIFQVLDISERLRAKGFDQGPLKIIEICSGKYANMFLNKDRVISLFMPCRINISDNDGQTTIMTLRPTIMPQFFQNISTEETSDVEKDIISIIDLAIDI